MEFVDIRQLLNSREIRENGRENCLEYTPARNLPLRVHYASAPNISLYFNSFICEKNIELERIWDLCIQVLE